MPDRFNFAAMQPIGPYGLTLQPKFVRWIPGEVAGRAFAKGMGASAGAEKRGGTGCGAVGRPAQGAQGRAFRSSIPEPWPVGFAGRVGSQPGASRGKACPAPEIGRASCRERVCQYV